MRTINFRGKRIDNGKWIDGSLIINPENKYPIIATVCSEYDDGRPVDNWREFEVDSETVGQFTGLTDKNGKEIYEGDIITYPNPSCKGVVMIGEYEFGSYDTYQKGCGVYLQSKMDSVCGYFNTKLVEIIGNIHENPELISIIS